MKRLRNVIISAVTITSIILMSLDSHAVSVNMTVSSGSWSGTHLVNLTAYNANATLGMSGPANQAVTARVRGMGYTSKGVQTIFYDSGEVPSSGAYVGSSASGNTTNGTAAYLHAYAYLNASLISSSTITR